MAEQLFRKQFFKVQIECKNLTVGISDINDLKLIHEVSEAEANDSFVDDDEDDFFENDNYLEYLKWKNNF